MKHAANKQAGWLLVLWLLSPLVPACDGLTGADLWIREGPPGATVLAGFGRLINRSRETLQVSEIRSTDFKLVMLHETVLQAGQAHMVARDRLLLSPGEVRALSPGGLLLMLMQPTVSLRRGQSAVVTFTCGNTQNSMVFSVRSSDQ